MRRLLVAAAIATFCCLPAWAAESYPPRPIRLVVPVGAGGGANHAWSNRSGKPCKAALIRVDGTPDTDLAAQSGAHP
jgi:hypothetical protein